jgi:hypothetical protein
MTTLSKGSEELRSKNGKPPGSDKSDNALPSVRGAWEAILFYGGIPTFTVYPLGLATLYLYQKSIRTYNHTDAWYAVSLIPKTTVFGVGAEVLLRSLTYTLVSGFFAATLFFSLFPIYSYFAADAASKAGVAGPLWKRVVETEARSLRTLAIVAFVVIAFLLLVPTSRFVLGNAGYVWLPSLLSGVGGAWLMARDYGRKRYMEEREAALRVRPQRWLLRGLIVLYVGALLSAVLAAAYAESGPDSTYQTVDLKLPKAVLDAGAGHECTAEAPCPLLSHSDGYWNIITPQEDDILSIPDSEVEESNVRILLGS